MTANSIGVTMYVASAAPAGGANTSAGFEALTWTQVKGLQSAPVLGVSHQNIAVSDLGTGFEAGVKGAASGSDSQFTCREIGSDAGQAAVETLAVDQNGIGSVKLVYGTGTDSGDGPAPATGDKVEYAQGYFHSWTPNQATLTSFQGFTASFRQNNFTVAATEPA